jgi:hypothetical protein
VNVSSEGNGTAESEEGRTEHFARARLRIVHPQMCRNFVLEAKMPSEILQDLWKGTTGQTLENKKLKSSLETDTNGNFDGEVGGDVSVPFGPPIRDTEPGRCGVL